mgnify:CR=1 FL=1
MTFFLPLAAALAAAGKFAEAVGWQEKVVKMVGENYKDFATKTLQRYQNEQPFAADPTPSVSLPSKTLTVRPSRPRPGRCSPPETALPAFMGSKA